METKFIPGDSVGIVKRGLGVELLDLPVKALPELKVGDKVKIIDSTCCPTHKTASYIGKFGAIKHADYRSCSVIVNKDTDEWWEYAHSDLELVVEEPKHRIPASDFAGKRFRLPKDEAECEIYRKWFIENTGVTVRNDLHQWENASLHLSSTVCNGNLCFSGLDHLDINIDHYIYGIPVELGAPIDVGPTEIEIERSELTLTDIETLSKELSEHVASIKNILNKFKG